MSGHPLIQDMPVIGFAPVATSLFSTLDGGGTVVVR
jgi:hypothetical protein